MFPFENRTKSIVVASYCMNLQVTCKVLPLGLITVGLLLYDEMDFAPWVPHTTLLPSTNKPVSIVYNCSYGQLETSF